MVDATTGWVLLLSVAIVATLAFLIFAFWFGWWMSGRAMGVSPYTGVPLRRATDLSYYAAEQALLFLYNFQQYDNRIFKLSRAAYCRETGRIFTECVTWMDTVKVDWTFLQKRYPGIWVSWGSLNSDQQRAISDAHESLEGFQTEVSSPSPAPRAIEPEYAYTKPGPLYVDIQTKVLLGWKVVPGTELEVLIVQKPVR
ncbi:conserved putative membrane protein [Candidatus Protochlamydia naegleriophila]|uniref:Conserved putative membrane protein n=1 Tax=Candidatus Protochlamydia naegleriophila TaxID=389348 RepID=A0A0U5JAZ5_9BACT|nr:hypothetical protein [Candidatus Protochlamydia naegleriophila]CUI17000.1 conserved putative membrane protein [Candidatus Protochlamydia naegleriophila]